MFNRSKEFARMIFSLESGKDASGSTFMLMIAGLVAFIVALAAII